MDWLRRFELSSYFLFILRPYSMVFRANSCCWLRDQSWKCSENHTYSCQGLNLGWRLSRQTPYLCTISELPFSCHWKSWTQMILKKKISMISSVKMLDQESVSLGNIHNLGFKAFSLSSFQRYFYDSFFLTSGNMFLPA